MTYHIRLRQQGKYQACEIRHSLTAGFFCDGLDFWRFIQQIPAKIKIPGIIEKIDSYRVNDNIID